MKSSTSLCVSMLGLLSACIVTMPANGIVAAVHVIFLPLLGGLVVVAFGTVVGLLMKSYRSLAYLIAAAILVAYLFLTFPFRECGRWWINCKSFQKDHPWSRHI